ncbi:hypothetical protein CcCBS67573_g06520 [Chytriomyces confervae]|uniref:Ion transport domain-containing protein n=1 Tax=Chytriomyces confervae TaxID=246404 RepID=A0A507F2N2_9FUNG|nr:hypothetical protein CcCBS67573_g06520 [Chytriomyces confervae]
MRARGARTQEYPGLSDTDFHALHKRSLQVVVEALINTLRNNVLDIAILLLLIMFIFGILEHYLFGSGAKSQSDWGELGNAIRTLFIFVCADGWIPYQDHIMADGLSPVKEMVGTLRHEDVVNVAHIHCNSTWLETYSIKLTHRENTLCRLQQLQFGIANCLAEYVEHRLTSRVNK